MLLLDRHKTSRAEAFMIQHNAYMSNLLTPNHSARGEKEKALPARRPKSPPPKLKLPPPAASPSKPSTPLTLWLPPAGIPTYFNEEGPVPASPDPRRKKTDITLGGSLSNVHTARSSTSKSK